MGSVALRNVSSNLELSKQFMAHAEAVFTSYSLSLAPDGRLVLQKDFDDGAHNMVTENRLGPKDIGAAHHSVGLYASAIATRATAPDNADAKRVIAANIIQKAHNFFCPGLWPFC
jgi:hypothetical protein